MATIDSVDLFLSRSASAGGNGWSTKVFLREIDAYTVNTGTGDILAEATAVSVDNIPEHGNQTWVTYTFSSPATITEAGFYAIEFTNTIINTGTSADLRVYESSAWSDANTGSPNTGKEHGWAYDPGTPQWVSSKNVAYRLNCTDNDGNDAISPNASYSTVVNIDIITPTNYRTVGVRAYVTVGDLPAKAYNPVPENGEEADGVFDYKLSWAEGARTDDVDIYIGSSSGNLSSIATGVTVSYYTVNSGDFPQDSIVYWRIDSNNDDGTTTGDEWWFDPRVEVATGPNPLDGASSVSTTQSRIYWDAGNKFQTFDVYINDGLVKSDVTTEYYDISNWVSWPLDADTGYTWKIDSKNIHSSEMSDTWSFTTGSGGTAGPDRPGDYDPDAIWDAANKVWVDDNSIFVAGGGRYQSQIIVIGHQVIYYGDI